VTYAELKSAREKYRYVPARLVRIKREASNGFTWKSLNLAADVPVNWQNADEAVRARYSSFELDEFHRALLNSTSDEELMHGLLSVVFWGFASGSKGRITSNRALARSRAFVCGRANATAQSSEDIIVHLIKCRDLLNTSQIADALQEAMKIKFLKMSFASKVLTFMNPAIAAVYDDVISSRLRENSDPTLRSMFVSTKLATSRVATVEQTKKYALWCQWCSSTAAELNAQCIRWTDWNRIERTWRAVDVERAFFALGR
jgi:hypothetical protein